MKASIIKTFLFFALFVPVSVSQNSKSDDIILEYSIQRERQQTEQLRVLIEIMIKEIKISQE